MDLLRAAAATHGFFTRQEVFEAGLDDKTIRRCLATRLWVRVRPGAYTFAEHWPDDREQRHRTVGRAAARRFGSRVALSHVTAALEHELLVWGASLDRVHVTRLDGGAGRTEAGVVHHEGLLLPGDLTTLRGRTVTSPARAAVESASLLTTEAALVVLDSVLHQGRATREELEEIHALMSGWPGLQASRLAIRLADGRAESVGESRTRYLFWSRRLPAPDLQHDVRDGSGRLVGTADFAWPEHRLLGEFDGKVKYQRYLRDGESPGDAVFREKRREDLLCELTGWRMIRFVWADLYDAAHTADRLRRMLRAAA
jgi:hypothetical protein